MPPAAPVPPSAAFYFPPPAVALPSAAFCVPALPHPFRWPVKLISAKSIKIFCADRKNCYIIKLSVHKNDE